MFGRHPISPEVLTLELLPSSLPQASYAKELIKRSIEAQKQFDKIKADLKRTQREYYDLHSRDLHVPEGKIVFVGTFRTNNPYQIVYTLHPLKNPESHFSQHYFPSKDILLLPNRPDSKNLPEEQIFGGTDLFGYPCDEAPGKTAMPNQTSLCCIFLQINPPRAIRN